MATRGVCVALALVLALVMLTAAGCGTSQESGPTGGSSQDSGGADGAGAAGGTTLTAEELVAERCTVCHERDRVDSASYDADGWRDVVERMVAKGAQLDDAEQALVIEYLAAQ